MEADVLGSMKMTHFSRLEVNLAVLQRLSLSEGEVRLYPMTSCKLAKARHNTEAEKT